jgi:putative N6-adenine-specific DNA methylase
LNTYFAVTLPGLEPFTAHELHSLGLLPGVSASAPDLESEGITSEYPAVPNSTSLHDWVSSWTEMEPGGVTFQGDLASLYRANLHLRTTTRVLARLGHFFYATSFPELFKYFTRLPWERFLTPSQPVTLRATSHRSRLYHSDAVARTLSAALEARMGQPCPLIKPDNRQTQQSQLIVIRLVEDRCTVSVDSSGSPLYKRGYRQAVAKAPLRETLAAALLMASGWDLASPLLDPFCGSGTIPIEAARMALGIPPGSDRRFAFMDWPGYEESLWQQVLKESRHQTKSVPLIQASDRDAGAITSARANAGRAGVENMIEFTCRAVSSIMPPQGLGWVITNPPYGRRLDTGKDLRNLYAQFGKVLREKCPGWNVSVMCSDRILLGQICKSLDTSLNLLNGGIRVLVGRGAVK